MPFVDVDGARLNVIARTASGKRRDTLLFLHGLGSSADDWTHQIARFEDRFDVLAVDFRNHGLSSRGHGGLPLERLASDAIAVLDAFDVSAAHVIGLSMGGCVALQLALDHPGRVASLTVANASADMRPKGLRVRTLMALRRPAFALYGMERMGLEQADRLFPDPGDAASKALSLESWNRVSKDDFLAQFGVVLHWHRTARLGELRMPVLAIGSDDDFSPSAWKRALADAVADGRFAAVEGRHMAPLEKPASFDAALGAFLDEVAGAGDDAGAGGGPRAASA